MPPRALYAVPVTDTHCGQRQLTDNNLTFIRFILNTMAPDGKSGASIIVLAGRTSRTGTINYDTVVCQLFWAGWGVSAGSGSMSSSQS